MNLADLLERLRRLDVALSCSGDTLHVEAPVGVLTPDLRGEIREHKAELLALLRYRTPAAHLYPHIGKKAQTPAGEGALWQAFANRIGVVIDGRVRFFRLAEVEPVKG